MRRVLAQTRVEILLTIRRGESLLAVVGIPVGVLIFFSGVDVLPHGTARPVDFLVPGTLGLAVVATGMVSLGIATGFERQTGMLKRLGATPLGREGLVAAKIASVAVIVLLQTAMIVGTGLVLGWRPAGGAGVAALGLALGTATFAGLGLVLAGNLRAETNLAVANGLFLVMLLLGGIVVPVSRLPEPLRAIARILPAEALTTMLRDGFADLPVAAEDLATLAVWAVLAGGAAARTFRWD